MYIWVNRRNETKYSSVSRSARNLCDHLRFSRVPAAWEGGCKPREMTRVRTVPTAPAGAVGRRASAESGLLALLALLCPLRGSAASPVGPTSA